MILPHDCIPVICQPINNSTIGGQVCQPPPDDAYILVPMPDGSVAWCKTTIPEMEQR